jgi:hypothetical protein
MFKTADRLVEGASLAFGIASVTRRNLPVFVLPTASLAASLSRLEGWEAFRLP